MKKFLMLALLGVSLTAGTAFSANEVAQKAAPKAVQITAQTKTIAEKGRWHAIHTKKQKLDCEDCHGGGEKDILFLRTGEPQGSSGAVDRKGCLECHQAPNKPTFFGKAQ
jgi:Zn finger protein HypA/HybF involved in hydrogenase expression